MIKLVSFNSSTQGKREEPTTNGLTTTAGTTTIAIPNTTTGPSTAGPSSAGPSTAGPSTAGPSPKAGPSTTTGPNPATASDTAGGSGSSSQGVQTQGTAGEKRDPEAEGLALLIPDIQETAKLMQKVVQEFHEQQASCSSRLMEGAGTVSVEETTSLSAEQRYLASMKLLQFGECCNILESVSRTMK